MIPGVIRAGGNVFGKVLAKKVVGVMGSGLVTLHMQGTLAGWSFAISRD